MSTAGGEPTHVTITLDYETLIKELAVATLDYGQRLSATQARLAACDCKIIPVVMNGMVSPLTSAAPSARFPSASAEHSSPETADVDSQVCDRPPALCHAHHVREWQHHGHTEINNCILLCSTHHRWYMLPDGTSPSAGILLNSDLLQFLTFTASP
jgi:hypothetical protein